MRQTTMGRPARLAMSTALMTVLLHQGSVAGMAQTPAALDLNGKLRFHAGEAFRPAAVAMNGVRAGFLQIADTPAEWGNGAGGYGKRVASSAAISGIRGVIAFGLDATLHQEPRYFRSEATGFWRRTGHALRGTVLTRTGGGGETLAAGRVGSAYGAAFLSNQWHPDRLNTVHRGFAGGSIRLGFDFAGNVAAEFWPDIRRRFSRRRP